MGHEKYNDNVFRVTAFIKANVGKSFTIPEIAKNAGFSERHVRRAFQEVLGQNVVSVVQAEKIRKAKSLLLDTNLDISRVSFESGFENHTNFSKVFHDKVGLTPSGFRKKALELKENPQSGASELDMESNQSNELYRDSFPGTSLGPNWKPFGGEWRNQEGKLTSGSPVNDVAFLKPLPENCRISFEVMSGSVPDMAMPNFAVALTDDSHRIQYCAFTLASGLGGTGHLRHHREGRKWNPDARVSENEWHTIVLEIRDDTLTFFTDEKEAFSLRDSFPPAYNSRCSLHIGSWHCNLQIRKFVVQDLGFMPATHPIRQGDALYNAGLPEKAMEFYLRFLKSGSAGDAEVMELRYKIGMCALRENAFSVAQDWMDKVVCLKEDKFWSEQARLAVLEIQWRRSDLESFRKHVESCIGDPKTRDSARVIVQRAFEDLSARGFVNEAILILETWLNLEREKKFACETIRHHFSEHLLRARRFAETEKVLKEVLQSQGLQDPMLSSMVSLMHLYCEWGKIPECEQARGAIEKITQDPFTRARCKLNEAMAFRSLGQFEKAVEIYQSMAEQFPLHPNLISHGKILVAHIHCGLGSPAKARAILQEIPVADPSRYLGSKDWLPIFLAEEDYIGALKSVTTEYHSTNVVVAIMAETGIKVGILMELAGQADKAKEMFEEVSQRFPGDKVCFYGPFAKALATNEPFDMDTMPYEHYRRSEMFFLVGLLKEKRGDLPAAKSLFEMSVREDPTFRWPAHISKKKIRSIETSAK